MTRTLALALAGWLVLHATPSRADVVRWRAPLATTGGATLAIDGAHVYVASTEAGGRGRIMRVPLAGGSAELVASLPFSPRAIVVDGAGIAVAGVDTDAAPPAPNGRIARVAKARDAKVEIVARVSGAVWSLATRDGVLYAVVDSRITRIVGDKVEPLAATRDLAVDWVAAGTAHAFAIVKQSCGDALFGFDADFRHAHTVGVDRATALVVGGDTAYVARRGDVESFDFRGEGSIVIDDLKRPVIAASDAGVAIGTAGNIAHIPGYAGAVLWLDARTHTTRVVYPHAASAVAVAGDRIFAVVGGELVALARP
jgi:hypothetical protein